MGRQVGLPNPSQAMVRANGRYLYIPVGGSNNVAAATLLVFTFVALWHDLSFKLLAWGWLVSLFLLPEIAARATIPLEKVSRVSSHH